MNVLHLNQSDLGGGAAIAGYRLHQGLRRVGVNSQLLVADARLKEETTTVLAPMSLAERVFFKLTFKIFPSHTNILRTWKILQTKAYQQADIVHFHNLHTGLFFNYLAISRITAEKPVVFTLHDMWSFTGHCGYSYDCEKWKQGCGRCPYPETYPAVQWDHTALELWLKKNVYARSKLTIVAPSLWLSNFARQSILGRFNVRMIPYGIDTDIYKPMDRAESRRHLGLPVDKIVLMFGCADLTDFRKGLDILIELLKALPQEVKEKIVLYAMGRETAGVEEATGIKTFLAGYVEGDLEKARSYSAADIFISTSRADNLPLVLQESLACGTPLLATDVGGVTDLVRDEITGFTAPVGDLDKMARHLIELIQNSALRCTLAAQCRRIAIEEYGLEAIARKYVHLYESLLPQGHIETIPAKSKFP